MEGDSQYLQCLWEELSRATGLKILFLRERTIREGNAITSYGEASIVSAEATRIVARVQLQISDAGEGEQPTPWGLMALYVNGRRVAPTDGCYMLYAYAEVDGRRKWICRGWEEDVYGEWADAERIPD